MRVYSAKTVAIFALGFAGLPCSADKVPDNWSGRFTPCERHFELLKPAAMSLGVKISTSNPELARQFQNALNFWTKVVDMDWHRDESSSCAIQLVDGTSEIVGPAVAQTQIPEWKKFQGWIAFDPHASLTNLGMYTAAVHEIGHLLGLKHSQNLNSVMFCNLAVGESKSLDRSDLEQLSFHHKLRLPPADGPLTVAQGRCLIIRPLESIFKPFSRQFQGWPGSE